MKGLGSSVPVGEISRRRGMVTVLAVWRDSSWQEANGVKSSQVRALHADVSLRNIWNYLQGFLSL